MCDMDFGDDSGMDIGMEIGVSEGLGSYEGTDDLYESRTFDEMSDISGVDEAEAMDMDIEEYPSLSEFEGVTDGSDNVEELLETSVIPEHGEFSSYEDIPPVSEFSDSSESDGWDSLNDVPFNGEEQTEIDAADEVIDTPTMEDTISELQELEINYDEIYGGLEQEELNRAFENINIDADPERLEASLESFQQQTWDNLTLDEQKESMSDLTDYVIETIGFDNPPHIEYYNNPRNGDYGGYNPSDNTLRVNEYMLANSEEAADTIAHELWHAHQRECANDPKDVRDYQYQFNYENYITPEMGHEAYENQLIEAEARAFARQFKGRIQEMAGRTN